MLSEDSHLSLLDSVFCSAKVLCEGKLCCLGHRKKVSALRLLCKIYHRADHNLHKHLHHFVAARNTRGQAALCDPLCRTDQFNRSFLPVTCCHQMCLMVPF